MKICHVIWGLNYGGIETMVTNIANIQAEDGHDVALMVINDAVDQPMLELISERVKKVFIRRRIGSHNPLHLLKMNLWMLRNRPDVVHFHDPNQFRWFLRPLLKKSCTTVHTDNYPEIERYVKNIPNLFSISEHVRNDVRNASGCDSEVVINGIDVSAFAKRNHIYDGTRPFRIVQLGRIKFSHKAQDLSVEAVSHLRQRGIRVELDIIGTGESSDDLRRLIDSHDLSDRVEMLGSRGQQYVREHIADYDLMVHPSRHEGFGLVIAEGMAAKVPVLVSDVDSQREIVANGSCGYIFANGDARAMADVIESIMNSTDQTRVENAFDRVCNTFDVRCTARIYLEKYASMTRNH